MSLEQIKQLITSLAKTVEDSQKIATPILARKLAKSVVNYPEDKTIGSMQRVIEKMADNNTLFITRANLRELYGKLYTNHTKFAEVFSEELGVEEQSSPITVMQRDDAKELTGYESADPILANALSSVFDKNLPVKMYSEAMARKARQNVSSTLDSWGLGPNMLEVADGNDRFLVLRASYDTPKGVTSFYIPVEIQGDKIAEATMFMGNTGVEELNNKSIKSYILSHTGNKLKVSGSSILGALVKSSSEDRVISDAELALTRLHASRENNTDLTGIVGLSMPGEAVRDVAVKQMDEFSSFEEQFTTTAGIASFAFGSTVIKTARDSLNRDLLNFGYKNPQIAVLDSNDTSVFFGVSLDGGKVAFKVPVKVAGGISKPTTMISNGSIAAFSAENINQLYFNNSVDYKVAAATSPLFKLKPSDLINSIRDAVADGNHAKAEDALNVLANSGDKKAYDTGFEIFLHGLNKVAEPVEECKCTMVVKSSASIHPICGHTGLPIGKVYQDKYGNCRPLYRRGMDETYEAVSFMNAKIFG